MSSEPIVCLLLEDDHASIFIIENVIKEFFPAISLITCKSIEEARSVFYAKKPSLLLLDINLPDGLSFDWLRELSINERTFSVIFTTAYSQYAIEAFKFSALDFLLKPFTQNELIIAVNKALKEVDDRNYRMQLETLFYNLHTEKVIDKKIVLKMVDEIRIIDTMDILAVEADNSYSTFHLKGGEKLTVSQAIKEYDQQLRTNGFMRVHQSYLVHLRYINSFKKKNNILILKEGLSIPVSLKKKSLVLAYLQHLK
ncbi:LytR/AlgR family response regulator transcription factor [Olivibacter domesticus]|uniref:Two component transcriptional regulator, LytTR family n=1 Tax=Olivibacter domesticus TaxID=407022 RepID=A0A1H7TBT9_OLID1|nr:LytTR family DNA-binding domain-containing protein [Olivibacter domesticus]SEL82332.1 two component transcriptional regulator, LytTR family [Olivibacter domesticus]